VEAAAADATTATERLLAVREGEGGFGLAATWLTSSLLARNFPSTDCCVDGGFAVTSLVAGVEVIASVSISNSTNTLCKRDAELGLHDQL
jgi:hypothetical protein